MISDTWYESMANVQSCYIHKPCIPIDEQLFLQSSQFMNSKPDKYGQKFWMAVDKDQNYVVNTFPYLGKD